MSQSGSCRDLTRRRLLATGVPALGLAGGRAALRDPAHPPVGDRGAGGRPARRPQPRAGGDRPRRRRPRGVPRRRRSTIVANGFDPHTILRDFDWGTTRRLASGRVRARVDAGGGGQGDRGRARHPLPGLDLQRPHPGPDAARPRGRAAADHVRQRLPPPAHDPLPRHPPGRDGRRARPRGGPDRARRAHRLRVRRAALRPAPLPLPRAPARRAHRQGALRRLPHRPEGGPRGGGRDGDGDERVRHELRPRQRALRGQHDRLHLHGASRSP